MTFVLETHQPHLCIQYEVLEAAQLAIESLDGILVDGTCIKVQRPVTELTLDCETLVNELEGDSENQGSIYLFGVSETFKEQLLQEPRLFLGLEAVILPKDLKNGKQKKILFPKIQKFWQCPAGPQHSHRQGLEAERQACSNPQAPPCLAQRLTT